MKRGGMTFKLNKQASKGVFAANLKISENDIKQIDEAVEMFLKKEYPIDTIEALQSKLGGKGMEALKIREKIKFTKRAIDIILKKSKDQKGRSYQLKKHYSLLAQYLKEGYAFVMKLREEITKEKLGYAIRIASGQKETLGIYSMEEMLNMTTLVKKTTGNFALAFKNVKTINETANKQLAFLSNENELSKQLISLLAANKKIRSQVFAARKQWNEINPNQKISVYYPGMNGFILERAFIAVGEGNVDKVNSFTIDTDRYSSGGDLQGEEVPKSLKDALKSLGQTIYDNLEVKNITDFGASLVDIDTLLKDLEKIIEICLDINEKDLNKSLEKEIFRNVNKLKIVKKEFFDKLDTAFENFENELFSKL